MTNIQKCIFKGPNKLDPLSLENLDNIPFKDVNLSLEITRIILKNNSRQGYFDN
jgi:hypothetical protein